MQIQVDVFLKTEFDIEVQRFVVEASCPTEASNKAYDLARTMGAVHYNFGLYSGDCTQSGQED